MATLLKSLLLLSLLFVSGSAQLPSLFGGFRNNPIDAVDEGVDTVKDDVDMVVNGGGINVADGDDDDITAPAKKLLPFLDKENAGDVEKSVPKEKSSLDDEPLPEKNPGSGKKKPDFETNYLGDWKIDNPNAGVSCMQIQLMPNNKAIMYDATNLGPSAIQLQPVGNCREIRNKPGEVDCWAHAVEYDVETAQVRTLKMNTNPWCSSGGLTVDGTLLSTGGYQKDDGESAVRLLSPCKDCEWKENVNGLAAPRWYSTQEKLEDGSFIVIGGQHQFSYEVVQNSLNFAKKSFDLPFLKDTTHPEFENNLYPFANLLPDGTVFVFANNRAIILDPASGKVVRELPALPGGSRNYPPSGMSALLPLKIPANGNGPVEAEVLVCGGGAPEGMGEANKKKNYLPALQDCGRITPTDPNAKWEFDKMPTRRVMGDMLLLPTGDVLLLNGAMDGVAGWTWAENPNLTPLLYSPGKKLGERFKSLKATDIPRMYHSSAAVLPDGKVLVGGSNTNPIYDMKAKYPTELRVEKFSPPYLDPTLEKHKPQILEGTSDKKLAYGKQFNVDIKLEDGVEPEDLKLTMLPPPFTTHGYSQNQRLLVLPVINFENGQITAVAPPSGKLAPPGYYLLYVVHRGVPSRGMWVTINK